jgi:hypothetical protein
MPIHVKKYNEGMSGQEVIEHPHVEEALEHLRQEKELKETAKRCRAVALEILEPFHYQTGARDFSIPGVGKCVAYLGSSERFDKTAMGLYLVEHGVSAGLVEKALRHATRRTVNENLTMRFTPEN